MEYLHASLILHSSGKKITEKAIGDIVTAAGLEPDKNRIKGLVAALGDVNIEEALKTAAVMPSAAAPAAAAAATPAAAAPAAAPVEEEEEEEESGLSSLFGWAFHSLFSFYFFIFLFSYFQKILFLSFFFPNKLIINKMVKNDNHTLI